MADDAPLHKVAAGVGLELQGAFDPNLEPARHAETVRLLLASLGR